MNGGWIKLYRDLLESSSWTCTNSKQKAILITILLLASHKEKGWIWKNKNFQIQPGQFITSLQSLAKKSGKDISIRNVRTALEHFENIGFLTNESTKTGRLVTIVNWGIYQSLDDETDKNTDKEVTKTRQTGDKQVTTIKNVRREECKNVIKKDFNNTLVYERVIKFYNDNRYNLPEVRNLTDKRKKNINARLKEHTEEDIQTVFLKARDSDFLQGKSGNWKGCGFDWLINPNNFVKVLEGNYDNKMNIPRGARELMEMRDEM